jgi:hypothetical protein
MIVYNLEKFVIDQMFNPYKTFLIPEDNLPENELARMLEYGERENALIRELRKNPERIIEVLRNNEKAYQCVFKRLANIDFKFYKWLKHPLIDQINAIVLAFRYAEDLSEQGGE